MGVGSRAGIERIPQPVLRIVAIGPAVPHRKIAVVVVGDSGIGRLIHVVRRCERSSVLGSFIAAAVEGQIRVRRGIAHCSSRQVHGAVLGITKNLLG